MDSNQILRANIKFLLKEKNIPIGELEKCIGVSQGYLSKFFKHGSQEMRLSTAIKIAEFFEVAINDLLDMSLPKVGHAKPLPGDVWNICGMDVTVLWVSEEYVLYKGMLETSEPTVSKTDSFVAIATFERETNEEGEANEGSGDVEQALTNS